MRLMSSPIGYLGVFLAVATIPGCNESSATHEASKKAQPKLTQPVPEHASGRVQAAPERAQAEPTDGDCESKGLMVWAERIDPESGKTVPRCGIRFELVETKDKDEGNVVGRIRALVIEPGRTRDEIGELLQWYYGQMRAELSGMSKPNKQIFVYAYDDRKRVTAGFGEWQGMVQAIVTDGAALPEQVAPQFKQPPAGAEKPSERDEMIYNVLLHEFAKNAGSEDEDTAMKRVSEKYKVTVE